MSLNQIDKLLETLISWFVWNNQITDELIGLRSTPTEENGALLGGCVNVVGGKVLPSVYMPIASATIPTWGRRCRENILVQLRECKHGSIPSLCTWFMIDYHFLLQCLFQGDHSHHDFSMLIRLVIKCFLSGSEITQHCTSLPPSFFVQLCSQSRTGRSGIMAAG